MHSLGYGNFTIDPDQLLRDVKIPSPFIDDELDFRLVLWDTYRADRYGKSILGYVFYRGNVPIFEGEEFCASPMHAIDSDDTLRALLGFLTLRPGDTDEEYFENYNTAQLEFADRYGESLSWLSDEECDESFEDWS